MKKHYLKQKAKALTPTIQIGKKGITDSLIEEIKKQVKKRNLVKIKILKSFAEKEDRKSIAALLAEKTDSVLIDQVGFIVVLGKKIKQ